MRKPKTKICTSCLNEKPINEFWKSSRNADGHSYLCKECDGKRVAEWAQENADYFQQKKKQKDIEEHRQAWHERLKYLSRRYSKSS